MGAVKKFIHKISLIVNIALVVAAVSMGVLIVRHYRSRSIHGDGQASVELRVGSQVQLPNVDWEKNGQTLLLGLSKNCHFCSESAPFYQRLAKDKANQRGLQVIAVFPETVDEARQYLNEMHVDLTDVRQTSFSSLGLKGIPTAVLIDRFGTVTAMWRGKLSAEAEDQVLNLLRTENGQSKQDSIVGTGQRINTDELRRLIKASTDVVVLDVRDRGAYAREHIQGARDIPVDELEARAINELSPATLIVIYCRCADAASSELARDILIKQGFRRVSILSE